MESGKLGRRRVHDHECDIAVQVKRKRKRDIEQDKSDSVQILGETHLHLDSADNELSKRLLPNAECNVAGIPLNHMNMSRYPVPTTTRGKDRLANGSMRDSPNNLVNLPPNPCESDRMLFVQQWINSIRSDIPLWVQTSLTHVVPLTNPDCYPSEADSVCTDRSSREAECSRLSPGTSLETGTAGITSNPLRSAFNYHSKTSNTAVTANALSVLCSRYPGTQQPNVVSSNDPHSATLPSGLDYPNTRGNEPMTGVTSNLPMTCNNGLNHMGFTANPLCRMMSCEMGKESSSRMAPVGRLFDDNETQLVVKLFRDYFTKGSCPILSEVRRRTANTVFEGRRTATSIRAKIKRLQTSGRWTDYAGI